MRQKKPQRCQVWDAPTRVFHWLMVLGFTTCYVTGEDDRWALVHITAGYMVLGLILFRLLWGFIGSRHARFSSFICGPKTIMDYVVCLCRNKTKHYAGHNPAGAVSIFLLLALGLLVTISGIMVNEEINYPGIDGIHEISSNTMLALVLIHITGVIISSLLHRENLIGAMISGCKPNCEGETISRNFVWLGVTMVLLTALFWIWSFKEKIL